MVATVLHGVPPEPWIVATRSPTAAERFTQQDDVSSISKLLTDASLPLIPWATLDLRRDARVLAEVGGPWARHRWRDRFLHSQNLAWDAFVALKDEEALRALRQGSALDRIAQALTFMHHVDIANASRIDRQAVIDTLEWLALRLERRILLWPRHVPALVE